MSVRRLSGSAWAALMFPVTQDEHGGDIHGEHVEPDIPGVWPAVDVHGDGAVLTVSRRAAPVTP